MQTYPSRNQFQSDLAINALLTSLEEIETAIHLNASMLYRAFPLYKDEEGNVIMADVILLSPRYGVVAIAVSKSNTQLNGEELERCREIEEQVPPFIHSRLIKNRLLRATPTRLSFEITPLIFAPLVTDLSAGGSHIANSTESLKSFFDELAKSTSLIDASIFDEIVGTIDGAKGLIRPKKRAPDLKAGSKGKLAEEVEAEITLFDHQQKHGMMGAITGPQRLRGLAGSGKTVVLAMKAAQMHLKEPDAKIAYTFSTKALYQHVRRLITRFYRQFDDRDPDWENLKILHAWGGKDNPGFYSEACKAHGINALRYQDVTASGDRFEFVCSQLLKEQIEPIYDYVFVDEGQDFALSFIRLTYSLAKKGRFVLAYDDLQTIFQAKTPSAAEIFGVDEKGNPKAEFEDDVILHKCYRNSREILVAAHALGFGIYGKIVQMLENKKHWEDIGYEVKSGDFTDGSKIIVSRPPENSLESISRSEDFDSIISYSLSKTSQDEIQLVTDGIRANIEDGLRPDDILVVCVDDKNAKPYLNRIERELWNHKIETNNLHDDPFGIRDFIKDGKVTLSTVHKAKGNESFMIYVVGTNALMDTSSVRKRNMLFTAITRAKGWVRICGIEQHTKNLEREFESIKKNFPNLIFTYPNPEEVKKMQRDLSGSADKRMRARRMLLQLKSEFSAEDLKSMIEEETFPEEY